MDNDPRTGDRSDVTRFTPRAGHALRASPESAPLSRPARLLRKAYHVAAGDVVRVILILAVGAIPVIRSYNHLASAGWLLAWLVLFLFSVVSEVYLKGLLADHTSRRFGEIHSNLAGSIDTITQKLLRSSSNGLDEEGSKACCVSLLHRIHDYVGTAVGAPDGVRLRVTLAVPLGDATKPSSLRVWCYDQPYEDRRWTELPLKLDGIPELEGSPAAFVTGAWQVIDDIRGIGDSADLYQRKFRSVLSIPVMAGGPRGTSLAVVNIDSTAPNFFREERVLAGVLPLVAPAINVIALVLLTRGEGSTYAFGG